MYFLIFLVFKELIIYWLFNMAVIFKIFSKWLLITVESQYQNLLEPTSVHISEYLRYQDYLQIFFDTDRKKNWAFNNFLRLLIRVTMKYGGTNYDYPKVIMT